MIRMVFMIKINEKKKLYSIKEDKYDIMILKLEKEDNIQEYHFLELDDALFNKDSEKIYEDKSI